jgi:hypothetical protein
MKAMHFGIWIDPELPDESDRLSLPPGFVSDGDSFLVWGEDADDDTIHLVYAYETHRLPDLSEDDMTGFSPVRGWVRRQGVWDRERQHIVRLRSQLAEKLVESNAQGLRLIDYVVISDSEDWAEDQAIWTLDGILSRVGS